MDDQLNNPKATISKTLPTFSLSAHSLWTHTGIGRILALPEIVDIIVGYLRPFQVLQARLVSREFKAAVSPYIQLHLDANFKGPAAGAAMLGLHLRRQNASLRKVSHECEACAKRSANHWMEPANPRPRELDHDQEQEEEQGLGQTKGRGLNATMLSEYGHLVGSCELVLDEMLQNRTVQQQQNEQWRKLVGLDKEGESDVDLVQKHCPNLTLLKIHHHRHGLAAYDDFAIAFLRLESLDVSFYDETDLETFFDILIQQAAPFETPSQPSSPLLPPADSTSTFAQYPLPQIQSRGLQRLKRLAVYNKSIWSSSRIYSWYILSDLLTTCPKLNTLILHGVNWDMSSPSTPRASSPNGPHSSSPDESLDSPDGSLDELARTDRFPQMQSLSLERCRISRGDIVRISHIFPNLKTLKIDSCRGQWLQALYAYVPIEIELLHQKNSDGTFIDIDLDTILGTEEDIEDIQYTAWFPKLERLQIVHDDTTQKKHNLWKLVDRCPNLADLDLNVTHIKMEHISAMARRRSSTGIEGPLYGGRGKMAGTSGDGGFRKLWIRFYHSEEHQHLRTQSMLQEKCFQGLVELSLCEHTVFTDFPDLTQFFTFAKTLTTLRLGLPHAVISGARIKTLNQILTLVPNLEVFVLDSKICDYQLFDGLGRCPLVGCFDEQHLAHHCSSNVVDEANDDEDPLGIEWMTKERPLLRVLGVKFTQSLQPIDMYDVDQFLIQRFRLLEQLDVETPHELNVNAWREQKRERGGLTVKHILPPG